MKTGTLLAIGAGAALAAFMFSRGRGGRGVQVIGQAFDNRGHPQPWAGLILGFGDPNARDRNGNLIHTIGREGCVLTTMAMAWNTLNPDAPTTPGLLNDILKGKPGAFRGAEMFTEVAAASIGMDMPHNERVDFSGQGRPTPPHIAAMRSSLDLALSRGGLGFIRVDENQDTGFTGDHTMLVYAGGGGVYQAADPQLVTTVTFDANLFASARNPFGAHFNYQGVGVATIYNG